MDAGKGEIHLVKISENKRDLIKLHGLVNAPKTSWRLSKTEILINYSDGLSQVFKADGSLKTVKCVKQS